MKCGQVAAPIWVRRNLFPASGNGPYNACQAGTPRESRAASAPWQNLEKELPMSEASFDTAQLNNCFDRMRQGDPAARNELLQRVAKRLERLARKMLQRYPGVQRWADTDDVLQNSLLRLL